MDRLPTTWRRPSSGPRSGETRGSRSGPAASRTRFPPTSTPITRSAFTSATACASWGTSRSIPRPSRRARLLRCRSSHAVRSPRPGYSGELAGGLRRANRLPDRVQLEGTSTDGESYVDLAVRLQELGTAGLGDVAHVRRATTGDLPFRLSCPRPTDEWDHPRRWLNGRCADTREGQPEGGPSRRRDRDGELRQLRAWMCLSSCLVVADPALVTDHRFFEISLAKP